MIETNQRGIDALNAGRWDEAQAAFEQALAEADDPMDAEIIRNNLGSIESRRRHEAMSKANQRGLAYYRAGDFISAIAAYRESLQYADLEEDRKILTANLRDAEAWLKSKQLGAKRDAEMRDALHQDKEAVNRIIKETLQSDSDLLALPAPSSPNSLEFKRPGQLPPATTESPETAFSKGNKDSAPVNLQPSSKWPVIDPGKIRGDKTTPKTQAADRFNAAVLLAALSATQGDFVAADTFVRDLLAERPNDPAALAVSRYIRNLKQANKPSDPRFTPKQDDAQALLEAVAHPDRQPPTTRWPGPAKPIVNRKVTVLLDAMDYGKGDWDKGMRYLDQLARQHPKDIAVREARKIFADLKAHEQPVKK